MLRERDDAERNRRQLEEEVQQAKMEIAKLEALRQAHSKTHSAQLEELQKALQEAQRREYKSTMANRSAPSTPRRDGDAAIDSCSDTESVLTRDTKDTVETEDASALHADLPADASPAYFLGQLSVEKKKRREAEREAKRVLDQKDAIGINQAKEVEIRLTAEIDRLTEAHKKERLEFEEQIEERRRRMLRKDESFVLQIKELNDVNDRKRRKYKDAAKRLSFELKDKKQRIEDFLEQASHGLLLNSRSWLHDAFEQSGLPAEQRDTQTEKALVALGYDSERIVAGCKRILSLETSGLESSEAMDESASASSSFLALDSGDAASRKLRSLRRMSSGNRLSSSSSRPSDRGQDKDRERRERRRSSRGSGRDRDSGRDSGPEADAESAEGRVEAKLMSPADGASPDDSGPGGANDLSLGMDSLLIGANDTSPALLPSSISRTRSKSRSSGGYSSADDEDKEGDFEDGDGEVKPSEAEADSVPSQPSYLEGFNANARTKERQRRERTPEEEAEREERRARRARRADEDFKAQERRRQRRAEYELQKIRSGRGVSVDGTTDDGSGAPLDRTRSSSGLERQRSSRGRSEDGDDDRRLRRSRSKESDGRRSGRDRDRDRDGDRDRDRDRERDRERRRSSRESGGGRDRDRSSRSPRSRDGRSITQDTENDENDVVGSPPVIAIISRSASGRSIDDLNK
jgi:hypothetical protein